MSGSHDRVTSTGVNDDRLNLIGLTYSFKDGKMSTLKARSQGRGCFFAIRFRRKSQQCYAFLTVIRKKYFPISAGGLIYRSYYRIKQKMITIHIESTNT